MRNCSVQVLIPALNEEEGIGRTIAEIKSCLGSPKVLVIDGKSIDKTAEIAKNLGAQLVVQNGLGKGDALSTAVKHIDSKVDYIVLTDADYTYPAEYLTQMIQILEKNPTVGMVCGNRFTSHLKLKEFNSLFYFGNRLLAITHNLLNGIELRDPLTGLRVVKAEIMRTWQVKSQSFDVEVELNHYVKQRGFEIIEVPIKYRHRLGQKKLKITHGAIILKRILQESRLEL